MEIAPRRQDRSQVAMIGEQTRMPAFPTLLIAADRLSREGLRRLLDASDFGVHWEAASVEDALTSFDETCAPAFVLLELVNRSSRDAASASVRDLRARFPGAKLVALAAGLSMVTLAGTMAAGLDGYVVKDISPESLIQSLRLVAAGERVLPSRLADLLVRADVQSEGPPVPSPELEQLSSREIQILQQLATGLSNKGIARRLGITEATVKVHLKSLLKKTHAQNRTQAAIWALHQGLSPSPGTTSDKDRQHPAKRQSDRDERLN
jgi:two-component system nitrate/nitrite response regulator NarL